MFAEMFAEIIVFLIFPLIVAGVLAFFVIGLGRIHDRRIKSIAEKQFRTLRIDAVNPQFQFRGADCVIVAETQSRVSTDYPHSGYAYLLWRICRNDCGEYFLFLSGDSPHLEHLTRERAMNALRAFPDIYAREFGGTHGA